MKKDLFKYLIEFVIVAFGVFLGIYLNGRGDDQQVTEQKQKALENILSELEHNREALQIAIKYHELIKVNFDSLMKTIPVETYQQPYFANKAFKYVYIKGWGGYGFADFEDTAFEVAKMSGALQNMDIDLIQAISGIYKKLDAQNSLQNTLQNRMFQVSSASTTYDVIGNVALLTGDNLGMEKGLLAALDERIVAIKEMSK